MRGLGRDFDRRGESDQPRLFPGPRCALMGLVKFSYFSSGWSIVRIGKERGAVN